MYYDAIPNDVKYWVARHFGGKIDKGGNRYLNHCIEVCNRAGRIAGLVGVNSAEAALVGLLHDIVEDCGVSLEEISDRFGPSVAHSVDCVSKRSGESREDYYERICLDKVAKVVKLADASHNSELSRIPIPNARDIKRCLGYSKKAAKLAKDLGL